MAVRPIHQAEERNRDEAEQRSLSSIFSELSNDVSTLIRKELELARAETSQKAKQAASGMMLMTVAAVLGLGAVIVLLMAAVYGLAEVLHIGWAALIVGAVTALAAALFAMVGRTSLRAQNIMPQRTVASLRDDADMLREQANERSQRK